MMVSSLYRLQPPFSPSPLTLAGVSWQKRLLLLTPEIHDVLDVTEVVVQSCVKRLNDAHGLLAKNIFQSGF